MEEEEQEQQNKNQQNSFLKQQGSKAKDKLKDELKKKIKQEILKILSNPKAALVIGIVIVVVILVVVFLSGALYIVKKWKNSKVNNSKPQAIATSYSANASTSTTDENGNIISKVALTTNSDKTGYEFAYNGNVEYLEDVRDRLEEEIEQEVSDFNDFELAVLGALMDNGTNLEYFTKEELHCLDEFIKAEASTQNLDLRTNEQKFDGKEYVSNNYIPAKLENLEEDEVPGTILIQRTNTNGNTSTILEYKTKADFDNLLAENNKDVINYFTINDEGNLVIAKWNNIKVTVEGEYPENLEDSKKSMPKDENIITTEEIAYNQYIAKYIMPFEFLVQLLVTTDEPDFCMELVNYVLNSKIVINIQEEQTVTVTDETRVYTVYSKDKKYVNYQVNAVQKEIESQDNYFLNYAKDDEGNECTNTNKDNPLEMTVKIHTEHTSNSYVFEIIEVDTWIAHYTKTYSTQEKVVEPTNIYNTEDEGSYKQIEAESIKPITDINSINNDKDVKTFIDKTKKNYESKIIAPKQINISDVVTDNQGNKFRLLYIKYNNGTTRQYRCAEIKDESGNGTGEYDLPPKLVITTEKVASTDVTKEIPEIRYIFNKTSSKNALGQVTYKYELQTDIDSIIECKVSSLAIDKFEKINLTNNIQTDVTKYPADPNPLVQTHIYATESGEPGSGYRDKDTVYEKFLIAYNNNGGARNNLGSIDSWLYEMMEESEATVELVDTVKYLLYMYDGKDRGVTELEGFEDLFNLESFITSTSGIYGNSIEEKIWWALIDAGYSKEAAAGVLGNLFHESGLRTNNLEGIFEGKLGYTDKSYTEAVNNGTYTREQFISDHTRKNCGAGYGLAQWTYNTRKAGLYDFAKYKGVSIDDENMQIEYLLGELSYSGGADGYATFQLSSYKGFTIDDWQNASTPVEAAEAFCWLFEKPAGTYNNARSSEAGEYYEQFKDKTKPSFSGTTVKAAGYEFPQYYQRDYVGSYGSSTIKAAGCGPTSLAMILAALKGDPSITPETVINNIKQNWPTGAYYIKGVGSSHCIFNNDFLNRYYGVSSQMYPTQASALQALENGYPVIGSETGHILAIIPAPDEYKAQGYKFYILDSGRGHGGLYKSVEEANAVVKGNLGFIAIIKP